MVDIAWGTWIEPVAQPELSLYKTCSTCGATRSRSAFRSLQKNPRELRAKCIPCERKYSRDWNRRNPGRHKLNKVVYNERHADKVMRARRNNELKYRLGITLAEAEAMIAAAGGCEVCGATEGDSRGYRLNVDHCHATGRIRGILCRRCNTALGQAKDDPGLLRRLADYLERFDG